MTLAHDHAQFWIAANNIITGENATFGPFGGPAIITHTNVRGQTNLRDKDSFHETLFIYIDPQDVGQLVGDEDDPDTWINEHGYDFWHGDEETRYDGWRQIKKVVTRRYPNGRPFISHDEPVGPFYTDLVIHTEPLT